MTLLATPAANADMQTLLPADVAERLDRIRPHTVGQSVDGVTRLVEQAFRNFPGTDPHLLVRLLTTVNQ